MIELKFILLQDFRMPSLGGGTVLQIGEAEPKKHILHRYQQECCYDENLDCAMCLSASGI